MTGESLVTAAIVLLAVSGMPGLFLGRRTELGAQVAAFLAVTGATAGLAGALLGFATGAGPGIVVRWLVPGGLFAVRLDALSVVFLLPIFLVALLGSLYGLEYWKQFEHEMNGRKLRLFYGLLPAGMALLVVARNGVLFLAGWEVMALAAFFLVTTEDHEAEVRATGWLYLAATHTSTLFLFAVFGLLAAAVGSFELKPVAAEAVSPGLANAIFLAALFGFGIKAGIMPLHVWLPSSHAIAPSHVSAIMSGVIIKMGIYGLVRITSLLPVPPPWWGGLVLGLGAISGVLGVLFAIGQHDLKRLLAYHSIENIGIIVMGLGLALAGRSLGRGEWVVLGMAAALLHTWNHALFKSLLFLAAGSVIHAVHTRDIDHLGGLAKTMPRTALFFLIGAVAICGLPPLNGLVSELFLYLGLFRSFIDDPPWLGGALAAAALALIGGLALACFVKVFSAVFLGAGRSDHVQHAHDPGTAMLLPMGVLAAGCLGIGLAPGLVEPLLEQGVADWAPEHDSTARRLGQLAPLAWVSVLGGSLVGLLLVLGAWLRWRLARSEVAAAVTWDCGYAAPTPRMQYTSSSFADTLVELFGWVLRPRVEPPAALPLFPGKAHYHSEVPDVVLEEAVLPACRSTATAFSWLHWVQRGGVQVYLLYILLTLIALLLWRR